MKWVVDSTNRFGWRPYYDQSELDNECERLVFKFLASKNGRVQFPISTDDLCVMVEQSASDLDLYADLSSLGMDVEGVTDFFPDKKPSVRISRELSSEPLKYHRLRTTLAHEYGHVRFHSFLWNSSQLEQPAARFSKKLSSQSHRYQQFLQTLAPKPVLKQTQPEYSIHSDDKSGSCFSCRPDSMLDALFSDWMEWQAGYVCGAILMPITEISTLVHKNLEGPTVQGWAMRDSLKAIELISRTEQNFDVSADAARVRLFKLGFIQTVT